MVTAEEIRSYLTKICQHYEKWWAVDPLTEIIADRQATFSFNQMVQKEEKGQKKDQPKITLTLFQGIQDYIESEPILLVGSPGVGKSTALLRCLVNFAKAELEKSKPRIPVLVQLKRYKDSFSCPEDRSGMLGLIKDTLKPDLWLELSDIEKLLFHEKEKRLILILDGLNEMPASTVRTELEEFRKNCANANVPLICTTRKGGGNIGIQIELEVQPLSPDEIERFLQECMPGQTQQVWQLLNRDNRELSRTPFVLWMLYNVFQETDNVSETLGEAFRQFFGSFKKHREAVPVNDERRKAWKPWMEHLAFTMLDASDPNDNSLVISDERAEKVLSECFGELYGNSSRIEELLKYHLLERFSETEISFHHQLIQEYYAAEYLWPRLAELTKHESGQNYTAFQINYLNYLKWTEAIALMLGLPEVNDDQSIKLIEQALKIDLRLGARLAGEVKPEIQARAIRLVQESSPTRLVNIALIEITKSEQAADCLKEALTHTEADIRRRAAWALKSMPENTAIPLIEIAMQDSDSKVCENATWALRQLKSPKSISLLNTILTENFSETSYRFAIYTLEDIASKEAILILLKATAHSQQNIKVTAIASLKKLNRQEVINAIAQAIDHEPISTKLIAIKMFVHLEDEAAILYLRQAQFSLIHEVHREATYSLQLLQQKQAYQIQGQIESARCNKEEKRKREIEQYKAELKVDHPIRRGNAIIHLTMVIGKDAIPFILEALDDPDGYVQSRASNVLAARIIRQFPDERDNLKAAVPKLVEILEQQDSRPHDQAALALGQLGDKTACPSLSKLFSKGDSSDRVSALEGLVQLGCSEAKPKLIEALDDPDAFVRSNAARGLAEIQCEEAIPALIDLLKDPDILVQSSIPEVLGKFQGNSTAKYLPTLFEHITTVGEMVLYAIAAIQSRCGFYNQDFHQKHLELIKSKSKNITNSSPDTNITQNFWGPVNGVIGNNEGDQNIFPTRQSYSKKDEYKIILSSLQSMALVMERNPKTFCLIEEEDLRNHFLVQLNGYYKGQATGETVNGLGKTDIIIRLEDENIFIGECKFWAGKIKLLETLDQLLSYTTWRDNQLGILVFSRNKNFSSVLSQIPTIIREHSSFSQEGEHSETRFRFALKNPNDAERKMDLAILVFNIPSDSEEISEN
jgi:HEAT repeat protein